MKDFNQKPYIYRGSEQLFKVLRSNLMYKTPINLSYWWNFGSLAMYALIIQITTGFMLALWYIPSCELAFNSVEYIMREVHYGWFLRYLHANGASFFFFIVYIHMAKAFYYGSYTYPREKIWYSGFIIFMLMVATAFFGYVLPWGQMSYWAATVITSLLSSIPYIGNSLLVFVWGGLSVSQPTLTRIYGLHFILPFVIGALVCSHLFLLHEHGSNNPLGVNSHDNIPFHPYYTSKDILGIWIANLALLFFVFFEPNFLSHPDNYIQADPEVTPLHIVPEWYFLPFYGILRSVPNKIGGILILACALACLALLPLISQPTIRSGRFRPLFQHFFWFFACDCILLGWSGGNPTTPPYYTICQVATFFYFFSFLLNYFIIWLENEIIFEDIEFMLVNSDLIYSGDLQEEDESKTK